MNETNIVIDCGHGGINTKGIYTTAPAKMFTFPTGEVIYEGVINRQIGEKVFNLLNQKGYCPIFTVNPDDATDLSLSKRVKLINGLKSPTIGVSIHSNASKDQKARGFEIWTSKGKTKADILAIHIGEEIKEEFPDIRFRKDLSDGDLDKESDFYVLRKTKYPMVLLENLFFDNYEDAQLLWFEDFQNRLANRICNGIIRYLKTI